MTLSLVSTDKPLPYVQRVGKYHYFRMKGFKKQRIKGEPGSLEYLQHYNELLTRATGFPTPIPEGRVRFLPGSIGWVIERYMVTELPHKKPGDR
jgi:hypothetical protein